MSLPFSYKFRQSSDFWYLTGFQEANAADLIGASLPGICVNWPLILVSRESAFDTEGLSHGAPWEGARTGTKGLYFGADDVSILVVPFILTHSQARHIHTTIRSLLSRYSLIYLDSAFTTVPKPKSLFNFLKDESVKETDDDLNFDFLPSRRRRQLAPEVAKLRRIKSKAEIEPIKQAADISATAHAKVRRNPF